MTMKKQSTKPLIKIKLGHKPKKEVEPHTFLISPSKTMIPKGEKNIIFPVHFLYGPEHSSSVTDIKTGDFELGTDGFMQAIFIFGDYVIKLRRYPYQDRVE